MLENRLLFFYKSRLSYWNLIGKFLWKRFLLTAILNVLFICAIYLVINIFPYNLKNDVVYWISFILILIMLLFSIAKIILKPSFAFSEKKYGVRYQTYQWDLFLCAIIKDYLIRRNIYVDNEVIDSEINNEKTKKTEETFNFLINRLEKQGEQQQKGSFLNIYLTSSAIAFTLFIPVWAAFNTWLIREVDDIDFSFRYVLTILFMPLVLVIFWKKIIWRDFLKVIMESILEPGLAKTSLLIEKLEIIKFSFKNSHYYKEIDDCLVEKKQVIESIIQDFDEHYRYYHPDPLERTFRKRKGEKKKEKSPSNNNISKS
ncbi:hypothetical protein [Priestia megaterium]|uniref:hypothetical protein n=1 Tax=Priestia megaterium TaxID=1404 RepID=UPI001DAD9824|nr:hypothetical protein [Priestia megaterium]CAH0324622.1 hypothetical protein SRABI82_05904 [Priestia megaterium]